jgi:hypothetical protein
MQTSANFVLLIALGLVGPVTAAVETYDIVPVH